MPQWDASRFIAHRGASRPAPENTLAALNKAWSLGARAAEVDVRLTRDRQIVLLHDRCTRRTGDKNLRVDRSDLQELKTVDVGRWKGAVWRGEPIPTLQEVLPTVPSGRKLLLEIKCGMELLDPLRDLLNESNLPDNQVELISFDRELLRELKRQLPQIRMFWLLALDYYRPEWLARHSREAIIRKVLESGLDGVDAWAGRLLNASLVAACKNQGLGVYAWTVNDKRQALQLLEMGVDAVTTDCDDWLAGL